MSRHAVIVGGALALAGAGPLSRTGSAAEKSFLLHGLPEAAYEIATWDALPGKKS